MPCVIRVCNILHVACDDSLPLLQSARGATHACDANYWGSTCVCNKGWTRCCNTHATPTNDWQISDHTAVIRIHATPTRQPQSWAAVTVTQYTHRAVIFAAAGKLTCAPTGGRWILPPPLRFFVDNGKTAALFHRYFYTLCAYNW